MALSRTDPEIFEALLDLQNQIFLLSQELTQEQQEDLDNRWNQITTTMEGSNVKIE